MMDETHRSREFLHGTSGFRGLAENTAQENPFEAGRLKPQ
jgi:hypothetical protein